MVKRAIKYVLQSFVRALGLEHELVLAFSQTESALRREAQRGTCVRTIIDVGASNGVWSRSATRVWPEADVLLVEANPVHERALKSTVSEHDNWQYVLAAASSAPGEIRFDASDPLGGVARQDLPEGASVHVVPAVTLDDEIERRGLRPPYLIKLDTHGVEIDILQGAGRAIESASILVIEAYNFKLGADAPRFWELCHFLECKGFFPIDLTEPLWRPYDGALWQFDLIFVPSTRKEFDHRSYV